MSSTQRYNEPVHVTGLAVFRCPLILLTAMVLCAYAIAEESNDSASPDQESKGRFDWVHGELEFDFDGEWSDSETDIDLGQSLRLRIDPPKYERIHIRGSVWVSEDVDSDSHNRSVLRDMDDNWDSDVHARIPYLYVDIDDLWGDSTLRLGRQRIQEGPAFTRIDGVYFKKRMPRLDWYAFGGWRASLYQEAHNDPAFGGGVSVRLTDTTRAALDAYRIKEDRNNYSGYRRHRITDILNRNFPRDVDREFTDSSVSLTLGQDITPNLRLSGRYSWYDSQSDELRIEALGFVPRWELAYEVSYRKLLNTKRDRVTNDTAFYRILGEYAEYDNWLFAVHMPVVEKISLSLEAEFRDTENNDAYLTNRDFNRYGLTVYAQDVYWDVNATFGVEQWDVDGREGDWSIFAEVDRAFGPVEVLLGASYEGYTDEYEVYNFWPNWRNQLRLALTPGSSPYLNNNFLVNLRDVRFMQQNEDIYSIYTRGTWTIRENQTVNLGVSYEHDDSEDSPYWRVRAGYTLAF